MGTNSLKIALLLENSVITILQVAHKITMTTKKDPNKIFLSLFFQISYLEHMMEFIGQPV